MNERQITLATRKLSEARAAHQTSPQSYLDATVDSIIECLQVVLQAHTPATSTPPERAPNVTSVGLVDAAIVSGKVGIRPVLIDALRTIAIMGRGCEELGHDNATGWSMFVQSRAVAERALGMGVSNPTAPDPNTYTPAFAVAVDAEVARLTAERDALLAALREIEVTSWNTDAYPVTVHRLARCAIAKANKP